MVTITLVVNPDQVLLETYEIDLIKPKIYIVLGVMLQNKATRSLPHQALIKLQLIHHSIPSAL